jgi:peptidoglycan hydrolase-like protein with peptidoglycan-binding domain
VTISHRRRVGVVVATLVVAAAATVAAYEVAGRSGRDGANAASGALPPATAQVRRETLRETLEVDGELGFGPTLTATCRRAGTVTWLPASGAVVGRDQPLYRLDTAPTVVLEGAVPAYRAMAPGVEGPDVAQLEQNLRALGYTGFDVDDEYTDATAEAVERWQEHHGLPETGVVELGRVVFTAGPVRVDSLESEVGQVAAAGQRILTYTGTTTVVTATLDVADGALAKPGVAVSVTLPGGRRQPGKVTGVSTVIEPGTGTNSEPTTRIEALVALDDQAAAAGLGQAAVDVTFTASERKDVLTVPVAALVALREGGFGVEVVEGTTTRFVPVTTGLFAGGRVEVSGDGLADGMTVGIPK